VGGNSGQHPPLEASEISAKILGTHRANNQPLRYAPTRALHNAIDATLRARPFKALREASRPL